MCKEKISTKKLAVPPDTLLRHLFLCGTFSFSFRTDQEGRGTFPEFLQSTWEAGVVGYDVDFIARNVVYYGANGERYLEEYPAVEIANV